MFKIMCRVSGGITGTRTAYLKDSDGQEASFPTMDEATAEAARLNDKMNGNPYRTASFSYRAVEAW